MGCYRSVLKTFLPYATTKGWVFSLPASDLQFRKILQLYPGPIVAAVHPIKRLPSFLILLSNSTHAKETVEQGGCEFLLFDQFAWTTCSCKFWLFELPAPAIREAVRLCVARAASSCSDQHNARSSYRCRHQQRGSRNNLVSVMPDALILLSGARYHIRTLSAASELCCETHDICNDSFIRTMTAEVAHCCQNRNLRSWSVDWLTITVLIFSWLQGTC